MPEPADTPQPEPEPVGNAEQETLELYRARVEGESDGKLTVDDDGDVVPNAALGYVPCPLCIGNGVVKEEYPQSPQFVRCFDCDGRGDVATGSLVPGKDHRMCLTCNGDGYLDTETAQRVLDERGITGERDPAPTP